MTSALYTYSLYGLDALVVLVLVLKVLAAVHNMPQADYFARSILSFTCLTLCAAYGVIASIVLRIVGYGGLSQWTTGRAFKWSMYATTGVQFVIEGEEHLLARPAVFISNHQTELDVLMLGTMFPKYCSVTAKKSLKYVPFLGWFMALSKSVFIDRGNRENARAAFDSAARVMNNEHQSVFIFPEGTRSYTDKAEMLPFKKGAFHLAVQAKVPVVPVVVANYSNVLNSRRRTFQSGTIPVKVLPPIQTANLTSADVDQLTESTRDIMLKELVRLTELARGQGIAIPADATHGMPKVSSTSSAAAKPSKPSGAKRRG